MSQAITKSGKIQDSFKLRQFVSRVPCLNWIPTKNKTKHKKQNFLLSLFWTSDGVGWVYFPQRVSLGKWGKMGKRSVAHLPYLQIVINAICKAILFFKNS